MYHGRRECRMTCQTYRWTEKFGQVATERSYVEDLHVYTCEACGRDHRLVEQAFEPFFCTCNRLVGVALESAS